MNAIIGYTNLAMKEPASENLHSYLKKIDMSSQHLLTLINDILEMSRIESGKVELEFSPEDLCKIFESIRDLFAEQMKQKKINFQLHLSQVENNLVWCDKKNLNRVLLNVLSNAFKFTPERGSVNVSLWEVGAGEEGYGFYEIRIQDTGIGMSKDFVGKIFTAFERERSSTNSRTEGTGLGLAITKSIVDMMGGTIEVLTSLGNGTEIIIRVKFKLATEEDLLKFGGDKPEESDEGASSEVSFAGKRALLVEDNLVNLEIAKMILLQTGFAVETAENGKAAVKMVEKSAPGYYDLILMDIQMPVMDGYTATKNIRLLENKALAQIPIVAMTANAFAEDVKAAEDAGMQAHIAKPVDVKLMIKTLARVLDGRKA
jgi:CheY-like chemotaxis protein